MASYTVQLTVEARRLDPSSCNAEQMAQWCGCGVASQVAGGTGTDRVVVSQSNGTLLVMQGDWLLRLGSVYFVMSDGEFRRTMFPGIPEAPPPLNPDSPPAPVEQPYYAKPEE